MPFISFPIYFTEDDYEKRENLGLAHETEISDMSINTQSICAYNAMDNGNVMVRMCNGDAYEVPLKLSLFEGILSNTEMILNIDKNLTEN